jgi:hypothetical protein
VIVKRKQVSETATAEHAADVALAAQYDGLLTEARAAEEELRAAQADGASLADLHRRGKLLDEALTAAMRAAFAAERAEIGPRGYDDRIYRRKAMAKPPVRAWTMEAQRLLTLRETHRLTGIVRIPRKPAV